MPLTVSVALCTHNGARYVAEQVASILGQTLPPTEIVLSDDASTDGTVEVVLDALAGSGVPLTVLRNETALGVTRNFEQAMLATTGEVIALCDQDDVWHPGRLARLLARLESGDVPLLVHSDARLTDDAGAPIGVSLLGALGVTDDEKRLIHAGDGFAALLRRNLVTGATAVVRRSLLEVAVPFPGSWVHDEWLAAVAGAVGRFDLVDEQLTDYRQHGGNQIGAGELSFRGKLARLAEPREARNRRLAERAQALADFVESHPVVDPAKRALAAGKLAHEQVRLGLPRARLRRLSPALREWRSGGYTRFGRGRADLLRDLVQPAR